ncbi:sulfurtransferase complex subunit TusD [Gammaproteobacteria bacterium AS21]|jgi:tRNA 2-thiouridine synthesizing protein D
MIFSLLIYTSKSNSQAEQTALRFTRSLLAKGHSIHRIFFYGDSVHTASNLKVTMRDEQDLTAQWLALSTQHQLDLVVCIAAAVKRGVIDESEAKRHQKPGANLQHGFSLSGLGQLADAAIHCDRMITFAN